MTFHARLTELLEKATKGPWTAGHPISKGHYGVCAYDYTYAIPQDINDAQLIAYLVNHAEAIRDLVVDMESIANNSCCDKCQEAALVAKSALAKLEES